VGPEVPVVGGQPLTPGVVTQVDGVGRGIGDAGEDQGEQPPPSGDRGSRPDEEVLHLAQDFVGVADEGEVVDPSSSTNRASGIWDPTWRPWLTGTRPSSRRWSTRVGTRTAGKTSARS
jgi:hypothetical protein